ncbi:hypothetical protein LLB_1252 [Legionella longbeachae D-4968]|nr:hypothetical protein LLB_1252 [Legionella longbeachae D-4968]
MVSEGQTKQTATRNHRYWCPIKPASFFSLKNMFKSQLKVTNLLSPESKEFSNLSPIKG